MRGIISTKDLPPFYTYFVYILCSPDLTNQPLTRRVIRPRSAQYLRQSIQITGLGSELFNRQLEKIKQTFNIFSREFREGALDPLSTDMYGRYPAFSVSQRYFTLRKNDPNSAVREFTSAIDPRGILAALSSDSMFHSENNVVEYYWRKDHGYVYHLAYILVKNTY